MTLLVTHVPVPATMCDLAQGRMHAGIRCRARGSPASKQADKELKDAVGSEAPVEVAVVSLGLHRGDKHLRTHATVLAVLPRLLALALALGWGHMPQ